MLKNNFIAPLIYISSSLLLFCLSFNLAAAHEVYVLDQTTVEDALSHPPLQVFSIIYEQAGRFFFWFCLVSAILIFIGIISFSKRLEAMCDPFLLRLRRYAPFIGRVTLGISVIASAYFASLFGPELPMSLFLPEAAILPFRIYLAVLGVLLTVGYKTRTAALLMMLTYVVMVFRFSHYMLTYLNYFGEMVIAFTLGSRVWALDSGVRKEYVPNLFKPLVRFVVGHGDFMLRIAFGVSLIYSALYAKFIHAQLAIDTVVQYHLTDYFHFTPPFLVLGALAVELLLGTLFILGIEVRFAAIFLTIFLTLSLLYFGEAVWPHIILVGGAFTIFAFGYGKFTLERSYLNHLKPNSKNEEPVF